MADPEASISDSEQSTQVQKMHVTVNFWGMIQNTVIHSINKGQLPALSFTGLIALIVVRLPAEHLPKLVDQILATVPSTAGVSYTLNIGLVIAWAVHSRSQRRLLSGEMDRIGREKTRLQEESTKRTLTSSSKKPLKKQTQS